MTAALALTGQDIGDAAESVRALLDKVAARTGRSENQFLALRVLAPRGPTTPPTALHDFLARPRQFGLDHASVTELLTRLEHDGLVSGSSAHGPGPARLTDKGHTVFDQLTESVTAATNQLYGGIDPPDLATARHVLTQVTERARSLSAGCHLLAITRRRRELGRGDVWTGQNGRPEQDVDTRRRHQETTRHHSTFEWGQR